MSLAVAANPPSALTLTRLKVMRNKSLHFGPRLSDHASTQTIIDIQGVQARSCQMLNIFLFARL